MQEHREGNDVRNNTLKAVTKSQQHKSAVIEDSSGNILMKSTAVLNQYNEYCSDLYNYELLSDIAYSRATRLPHKKRKACLCRRKRLNLKRLSAI